MTHGSASHKAVGDAYAFRVDHDFVSAPAVFSREDVPANGRIIRNLAMAANIVMSHILHFYHLVALDYVDVNGTGLIPKGFFCPNYDNKYYARGIDPVLQTTGNGGAVYTVNDLGNNYPAWRGGGVYYGDLTPYFAGQYVRALKARRMAHQLGALFTGKMPHASCYTPGCVTTKPYDPTLGGVDHAVVRKVHELLYGGPGFDPYFGGNHPINGSPLSVTNPHPESILGFIGKPKDFWVWANGGFLPSDLPAWAAPGVPGAHPGAGGSWKEYTGTHLFDAVAAAHVFPEYFWFGSGYGRYLAWGIFEGGAAEGISIMSSPDGRLITRGRTHIPQAPKGGAYAWNYAHYVADHMKVREFTHSSWYIDPAIEALNRGRHPWYGRTSPNPNKLGGYTFAKAPRYKWANTELGPQEGGNGWIAGPNDYVPYEVGPLARAMSNASLLGTAGGPASQGEVLAVDAGQAYAYYPGILADVDTVLGGYLGMGAIGVFPNKGANLTTHITTLQGLAGGPVFYLPPGAIPQAVTTNTYHSDYMGGATLDRIAARALESYFIGMQMLSWFNTLDPTKPSNLTRQFPWGGRNDRTAPKLSKGAGLTEAPRGALAHWIKIGVRRAHPQYFRYRGRVSNYQIITPTAWNISPKDHNSAMGPIERCIWGTPTVGVSEPLEVIRVTHSFDICCACTVHVTNPDKKKVFKAVLEPSP